MYCKEIASISDKHLQVYSLILSSYLTIYDFLSFNNCLVIT